MLNFASMRFTSSIILLLIAFAVHAQDWQNMQITANLENGQVCKFMHNFEYEGIISRNYDSKYYSKVSNYSNANAPYRKDQPASVTIPLPEVTSCPVQLNYYDTEYPDIVYSIQVPEGANEAEIWNLVPGREYHYCVEDMTEGDITTTGQLRQIRVDSGFNVRELGGYPANDDKHIQYGLIYRGSQLLGNQNSYNFNSEDLEELKRIGIKAELDLRENFAQEESALGSEYDFLHLYWRDCNDILALYSDDIRQAFEFIHDNLAANRPVYIHCTFGADRTGTLCALIEALCGVSIGNIYKDYELTSMCSSFNPELMRYYFIINQRIIRPLDINTEEEIVPKVRDYLVNTCEIAEETLDELVDILLNGIDTQTQIRQHRIIDMPATFTLQGVRTSTSTHGIVIERDAEGRTRKVMQ